MELTGSIAIAVLIGAVLHAAWNALIKSGRDKQLDTALIHSLGAVFALPVVIYVGLPDRVAWPYIGVTTVVHVGYYIALAGAYKHGDLGLTYPVMRGTAPLLVALASHTVLGESLSLVAWMGVALVCCGVLALGLSPSALQGAEAQRRTALRFALTNAAIIALYTVVDGLGVRASGNALAYVATLFLLDGIPYLLLVMWQRGAHRGAALAYMAGRWKLAALGAAASLGSYGIALWAMTHAPVATVAALRETSVLFAAWIGTVFLGERFGWQRGIGTVVIVTGVLLLRFN